MNIEQIENEILDCLRGDADLNAICEPKLLPDDLEEYSTPMRKSLATIVFSGEKFERNQSVSEISQHLALSFTISVQSRLLRGDNGVYAVAEKVKSILLGFRPSDCGPMTLDEHKFSGYQNAVWEHLITFSCSSLRSQLMPNHLPDHNVTGTDEEVFYVPPNLTVNENVQV